MSGRRYRGRAAAGAVDLLTELLYERQKEERSTRQRAVEMAQKFKVEIATERAGKGLPYEDPFTGQQMPGLSSSIPAGLEPESYTDPITGTKYGRPRGASDISAEEERKFLEEAPMTPGRPYGGAVPLGAQRRTALQGAINMGQTESPAAAVGEEIVRTGTDTATGRRVGQTKSGRIIPLN